MIEEGGEHAHLDLMTEINKRMKTDHAFAEFAKGFPVNTMNEEWPSPTKFECLRALMETYEEHCGRMDDYALKYVKYFVRECET